MVVCGARWCLQYLQLLTDVVIWTTSNEESEFPSELFYDLTRLIDFSFLMSHFLSMKLYVKCDVILIDIDKSLPKFIVDVVWSVFGLIYLRNWRWKLNDLFIQGVPKKLYIVLEGRSSLKFWARNKSQGCFGILRFSALNCI